MLKTTFKRFEVIWSAQANHITSDFLKAIFHKFYLGHSRILCPQGYSRGINQSGLFPRKPFGHLMLSFVLLCYLSCCLFISSFSRSFPFFFLNNILPKFQLAKAILILRFLSTSLGQSNMSRCYDSKARTKNQWKLYFCYLGWNVVLSFFNKNMWLEKKFFDWFPAYCEVTKSYKLMFYYFLN